MFFASPKKPKEKGLGGNFDLPDLRHQTIVKTALFYAVKPMGGRVHRLRSAGLAFRWLNLTSRPVSRLSEMKEKNSKSNFSHLDYSMKKLFRSVMKHAAHSWKALTVRNPTSIVSK